MALQAGFVWDARVNHLPVIAILDDEPKLRKALRRLLVAHGFAVVTFEHGDDLILALSAQPLDCLLLDLHMESTNGFDVLEAIAARGITTPVVVITGHGEPDIASRVMAMGASSYLNKPVDESSLLAAIGEAIGTRSSSWKPPL
ncbi:MAG: response regulator [Verrucomicrobiaceae bacterium]|nr:MAG: response regulator [Verrucomicrobiaceae bacterium]